MKRFQITFKGQVYELDVEEISVSAPAPVSAQTVSVPTPTPVAAPVPTPVKAAAPAGGKTLLAPIPGKILELNTKVGDYVKRGDVVCILEAMKMQNEIMANQDGTIADIRVAVGQNVSTGEVLIIFS